MVMQNDAIEPADGTEIVHVDEGAMSALVRSEVAAQLDAAHRYPRSIKRFLSEAQSLATLTTEVAESCIYSLPRDGKVIAGPSVRLAEICSSAYGNLQVAARVLGAEETEVVAQGAAWDMEKNLRCTVEMRRRIVSKYNKRYNADMITVTGNAAASIALRNAIFRVIPRAYVDQIYHVARAVSVGDAKTLGVRREQILGRLLKIGVTVERVLTRLEKRGIEDIGLEELEVLIGLGTAIKGGELSIDAAFPESKPTELADAPEGKRMSLRKPPASEPTQPAAPMRESGEEG